jgi:NADH-quinone oxidoreductase subunit C
MSELRKKILDVVGLEPESVDGVIQGLKLRVESTKAVETVMSLKNIGYNFLTMLTAVCREDGFDVVYLLDDWTHKQQIWVYSFVSEEEPKLPSLTPTWLAADYLEREVFDMFGIEFVGHPNLERILTPEGFTEFPLRKDYKETD